MLKVDQSTYTPALLDKIVFAAADSCSYKKSVRSLNRLAGASVSATEIGRLTCLIGTELLAERDRAADRHQRRELPAENALPVSIACVEVDGGRIRTRAPQQSRGVHEHRWKETKVAALWKMEGAVFEHDPAPEPPATFLDSQRLPQLVKELKRQRAEQHQREEKEQETPKSSRETEAARASATTAALNPLIEDAAAQPPREREWPPRRVFRTCVATLRDVYGFGPLVAAEAQRRGFYAAARQVFLGDGDHKNWTVHKLHFPYFTAVTDFVHVVSYLYEAAATVTSSWAAHWEQYTVWMKACWQGRVANVLTELREWQTRLGLPEKETPDHDPRQILTRTLTYLQNNAERMNYADYRQQGLPITSCLVESLIKELNDRMKGTEQFWNRPDAPQGEAMLQVVASHLSDGNPLQNHILSRPGSLYYRRTTQKPQPTAIK